MISGTQPSTDRKQALMSTEHAPDRTSDPAGDPIGKASDRFALPILIVCLLFAICQLGFNALTLDTWMDEGKYLMKGYWYLTGQVPSYSTIDPTFYMPLPFYSVGAMEWLFGIGYLPGRALAIFFAIVCLVLVYLTGARIGHSRLAGVGAAVLVAGYPVTLTYFATATPYAMVSCLSLALILVLLAVRARRVAWGASGIILWALLFTRPDMLPIAMIPAGWALLIEPGRKIECLAIAFLTFLAASLATVWIFGHGLLEVILDVPGLSQIATLLGAPPAPISRILPLTVSPLDPVLSLREVPTYFYLYFLRPYFAVSAITLTVIALRIFSVWREPGERRVQADRSDPRLFLDYDAAALPAVWFVLVRQLRCSLHELLPAGGGAWRGCPARRSFSADTWPAPDVRGVHRRMRHGRGNAGLSFIPDPVAPQDRQRPTSCDGTGGAIAAGPFRDEPRAGAERSRGGCTSGLAGRRRDRGAVALSSDEFSRTEARSNPKGARNCRRDHLGIRILERGRLSGRGA